MLNFVTNFCIWLIYPDDLFVEEIYSHNPKIHDIMIWLNVTKKYKRMKFVDEKKFR